MTKYLKIAVDQLRYNTSLLIILCIEFVIMISCFSICYGGLELYMLKDKMYKESQLKNFYYVARSLDPEENIETEKVTKETQLPLLRFENTIGMDCYTTINFYSKSVFDNINIYVSKGESIDMNKDYGDYVPCLIASKLAQEYKVGNFYTFKKDDNSEIGKFYICGVVKNDLFFGDTYCGFEYNTKKVIAYDPKNLIDKTKDFHVFQLLNTSSNPNFADEYKDNIDNHDFQSYDYYYQNHLRMQKEIIIPYIVLSITFFALSIAGLLSYSVVSQDLVKRQTGIFYLCGAKIRSVVFITLLKTFIVVIVPAIISIPVISYIRDNTDIGARTLISSRGYGLSLVMCLGALGISSIISLMKIDRKKITHSIKEF